MDNTQVIKTLEKFALQKYLHNLTEAKMHKVTLFTAFAQTGALNRSDAVNFIMVDDLMKLIGLNSGCFAN